MAHAKVFVSQLLPWQQAVMEHPARYKVLACGRQVGKTELAKQWLIDGVLPMLREDGETRGYPCAYMAPTTKMTSQCWREISTTLRSVIVRKNEQERNLQLAGGGSLEFWSLENPEAPRGRRYKRVVIDEAAFVHSGQVWEATVQPTTIALRGSVMFLSTPRGKNWFWKLFNMAAYGSDPDWAAFQLPTSANPVISENEIEGARRRLPAKIFEQEYMAQFISDAGQIFRNVRDVATAERQEAPIPGHAYFIGADFAKSEDFSVFAVVDATERALVRLERTQTLDWNLQVSHLKGLCHLFRPAAVVAERNAMGDVIVDLLRQDGIFVQDFFMSGPSKAAIVQDLAYAFDAQTIRILDDPILIAELEAFEGFQSAGGSVRYSAPDGGHDDTVIALMLAWHGLSTSYVVEARYWRFAT